MVAFLLLRYDLQEKNLFRLKAIVSSEKNGTNGRLKVCRKERAYVWTLKGSNFCVKCNFCANDTDLHLESAVVCPVWLGGLLNFFPNENFRTSFAKSLRSKLDSERSYNESNNEASLNEISKPSCGKSSSRIESDPERSYNEAIIEASLNQNPKSFCDKSLFRTESDDERSYYESNIEAILNETFTWSCVKSLFRTESDYKRSYNVSNVESNTEAILNETLKCSCAKSPLVSTYLVCSHNESMGKASKTFSLLVLRQAQTVTHKVCLPINIIEPSLSITNLAAVKALAMTSHKTPKVLRTFQKLITSKATYDFYLGSERISIAMRIPITQTPSSQAFITMPLLIPTFTLFHLSAIILQRLRCSNDVEENPGPLEDATLSVLSYNVRGLNDEKKLRHLINQLYQQNPGKNRDFVACLQETYLERDGKIPYLWRGNYHLTPGLGNSQGCITLLSPHLEVIDSREIGNRCHILACKRSGENNISLIIANIYAPNPNNAEKLNFFEQVFEAVGDLELQYNCSNTMVMGDFNLALKANETKNRLYSAQEQRMAMAVKDLIQSSNMSDLWEKKPVFTWKRANSDTFSTIDRIASNNTNLKICEKAANWSLSCSDHASVEVSFKVATDRSAKRSRITRLDPSLAKDPSAREAIISGYHEMVSTAQGNWDPHTKLDFAKMCIRTVVERVQAERKTGEASEEESINEELNLAITQLAAGGARDVGDLVEYIEELRGRKAELVEKKGSRVAEKLKTKWYNEGEKSSKYFLRLLNRNMPDDFKILEGQGGRLLNEPDQIEKEIINFYKALYEDEKELEIEEEPDFLNNIRSISDEDGRGIAAPITMEELRATLETCSDSAPGPDGIPYLIIGLLWSSFGKLLTDAWNHSLRIGSLPLSHRTSFLKLIPKEGKDLTKLTNWRPITLSNCDHKLITKTYSKRMCDKLSSVIGHQQTAYLKGRLINDNIRAMLGSIELANFEDVSGLIVSLDAKKAFDSVDHRYIERCLTKFGCSHFIPIFRILYSELATSIIVNGKIVPGFKIKRGVKQGDALSCILFIMCMEPLIRNIDSNPNISPIVARSLNNSLPKTYAYADDVNCVTKDREIDLQGIFNEYERLTKNSGLELNADKTEIIRLGRNPIERQYNVSYQGSLHVINTKPSIKINGIIFQRNRRDLVTSNVDAVIARMDKQLRSWSRRSLLILGKILIIKTFAMSQSIFLMQSLTLDATDFKKLNAIMFRFIWNRHYLAAKAPERIKREIVFKPVRQGGLGMLDATELDASLKLRALGRLLNTRHPFLSLVKNKLDLSNFFVPTCNTNVDSVTSKAMQLLTADRAKLWNDPELEHNTNLLAAIRQTNLRHLVTPQGRNSLQFFMLWNRGARLVKDLDRAALRHIIMHISGDKRARVERAVATPIRDINLADKIYVNKKFVSLPKLGSKEIRMRHKLSPITEFKFDDLSLRVNESLSLFLRISKLSSTVHKSLLLRLIHGEIYTKERLHRFGMIDSPLCPRCDEIDTLKHKFYECEYAKRIWKQTLELEGLSVSNDAARDILAIGSSGNSRLTLHSEIVLRLQYLKDDSDHLIHPKSLVKIALKDLIRKEGNGKIKTDLQDLLR